MILSITKKIPYKPFQKNRNKPKTSLTIQHVYNGFGYDQLGMTYLDFEISGKVM